MIFGYNMRYDRVLENIQHFTLIFMLTSNPFILFYLFILFIYIYFIYYYLLLFLFYFYFYFEGRTQNWVTTTLLSFHSFMISFRNLWWYLCLSQWNGRLLNCFAKWNFSGWWNEELKLPSKWLGDTASGLMALGLKHLHCATFFKKNTCTTTLKLLVASVQ